jgi:hypothetical protein
VTFLLTLLSSTESAFLVLVVEIDLLLQVSQYLVGHKALTASMTQASDELLASSFETRAAGESF